MRWPRCTRAWTAGDSVESGGSTLTMRVFGRSPKTGGNPLWLRNERIDEYRLRTSWGMTSLTPRTMRELTAADDSDG